MMKIDTIRAWKDEEYRKTLTAEQLQSVAANPAGAANLSNDEMNKVTGGIGNTWGNGLGIGGNPGPLTWTDCCAVE